MPELPGFPFEQPPLPRQYAEANLVIRRHVGPREIATDYCWYKLLNWKRLRENTFTDGPRAETPLHVGFLWQRDYEEMNRVTLGFRPHCVGSWHWYVCRQCGRSFAQARPPHMMRSRHCGCLRTPERTKKQLGEGAQVARLEGETFGLLTIVCYRLAQRTPTGYVAGGWEAQCTCGRIEILPTVEFRFLRKFGCRDCVPEEYSGAAGRKALYSRHGQLLRAHKAKLAVERPDAQAITPESVSRPVSRSL